MGYRSKWHLTVQDPQMDRTVRHALSRLAYPAENLPEPFHDAISPFTEDARWWGGECKWYTHEADCLAVSRAHPETVFTVRQLGEDWDHACETVYRDGKGEWTDLPDPRETGDWTGWEWALDKP